MPFYRSAIRISTWKDHVFYTTKEDDKPQEPETRSSGEQHDADIFTVWPKMEVLFCNWLVAKYQDGALWIKGECGTGTSFEVSYQGAHTVDWKPINLDEIEREDYDDCQYCGCQCNSPTELHEHLTKWHPITLGLEADQANKTVPSPLTLDPAEDDPHSWGYLIKNQETVWIRSSTGEQAHIWTNKHGNLFIGHFESDEPVA